jgi:outer membrane protein insertion porin family/translocation and assembly module TamA
LRSTRTPASPRAPWGPRARRGAALALAAALCLAGAARADGPAPPRVAALRFEGVSAFDEDVLAKRLVTAAPSWKFWKEKPPFDAADLEADVVELRSYYANRGWYRAEITPELDWSRDRSTVEIVLHVKEGEPVRLETFSVALPERLDGEALDRGALLAGLPLEEGRVFGATAYHAAKQQLLARLAERHHPAARLEGGAEVDPDALAARVEWTVDPGPFVRIGPITVHGLAEVEESLVRRELTVVEGEPYAPSALEASRSAVFGLGLFRSVSILSKAPKPAPGGGPAERVGDAVRWPVDVWVEERKPRSIRLALGYGSEEQVRGAIGWQHRNFHGQARSLDLSLQGSALGVAATGRLTQPRFLDRETSLELASSAGYETLPAYDAVRVGARASLLRPLSPLLLDWSGRLSYELEFGWVQDLKIDDDELADSPTLDLLNSFEIALRRDTTDSPIAPTRGSRLDLSIMPAVGNNLAFTRLSAEARAYRAVAGAVLAVRAGGGVLQPLGGFDAVDVPVYRRFFAGGSSSVRGYGYQRAGPLDDDDDPLGGLTLTEASVELRVPIPLWGRLRDRLGAVAFLDGGQLSEPAFAWRTRDLFFGGGVGLRVRTPLGPLRLDVGLPIHPRDGFDAYQVYFSVGEAF